MKRKIHKLTIKPEYEFSLIGISSHENDYRLTWAMNSVLDFKFTKFQNLEINDSEQNIFQEFSVFLFVDEDNYLTYHLISNKCDAGFLLSELKNIDFFLKITGEISEGQMKRIVDSLKSIDIINASFQIDPKTLKAKQKLIF